MERKASSLEDVVWPIVGSRRNLIRQGSGPWSYGSIKRNGMVNRGIDIFCSQCDVYSPVHGEVVDASGNRVIISLNQEIKRDKRLPDDSAVIISGIDVANGISGKKVTPDTIIGKSKKDSSENTFSVHIELNTIWIDYDITDKEKRNGKIITGIAMNPDIIFFDSIPR